MQPIPFNITHQLKCQLGPMYGENTHIRADVSLSLNLNQCLLSFNDWPHVNGTDGKVDRNSLLANFEVWLNTYGGMDLFRQHMMKVMTDNDDWEYLDKAGADAIALHEKLNKAEI